MLNALISLLALAQDSADIMPSDGDGTMEQGNPWSGIIMMIAIIAIFYFLMIRPQQKKQKEIKKFREGIKVGDRIITAGGIHGKVTSLFQSPPKLALKLTKDRYIQLVHQDKKRLLKKMLNS